MTIGPLSKAVNPDFADRSGWLTLPAGQQVLQIQLGDPARGPTMWFIHAGPGVVTTPPARPSSGLLRIVVDGTAESDHGVRHAGTTTLFGSAHPHAPVTAGRNGLSEIAVLADRYGSPDPFGWADHLHERH